MPRVKKTHPTAGPAKKPRTLLPRPKNLPRAPAQPVPQHQQITSTPKDDCLSIISSLRTASGDFSGGFDTTFHYTETHKILGEWGQVRLVAMLLERPIDQALSFNLVNEPTRVLIKLRWIAYKGLGYAVDIERPNSPVIRFVFRLKTCAVQNAFDGITMLKIK